MKILVLGGTGAMGGPLVDILKQSSEVYVTTRRDCIDDKGRVTYIKGNAKNMVFLREVLEMYLWDAVVDFMVWYREFPNIASLILKNTRQYVFVSSARVYSQTDMLITETTPRLLDVSEDKKYLSTNEYALAKAREEDFLTNSGYTNYTIIRPSITYNTTRLQLGVYEKEAWLYRALHGRSIVFSRDIENKLTTMTYGVDVATGIFSIIGKKEALGDIFHITESHSLLWKEVLGIYLSVLKEHLGRNVDVVMTERCSNFNFPERKYQIIYCRYFNRTFDNTKIGRFCAIEHFERAERGLRECLESFLQNPCFSKIDWALEGVNDRLTGEITPLSEIPANGSRIAYLSYRYNMGWLYRILNRIHKIIKLTKL